MACSPLRFGSDAGGQYSVALAGHLPRHHNMKQIFSRPSLWHISYRGPSYVWHGRNMGSQAVAIEEMEANESNENKFRKWQADETKVLIAAKNQHDLRKFESIETAGIQLKVKNNWRDIETVCKQRGVQRSAEQCRGRWRRLMLTYLQIKNWEKNKTPELLSYWSMKQDEKRATGVLLSSLDQSTYNLLDKLYNSRADVVKDGLIEDAFEEVAEFGSVEHMLSEQGMQRPLPEKSEAGGTTNALFLSASEEESYESHGTSSQFSSAETNAQSRKQVELVVGVTASVEDADRANGYSSSLGIVVSHEMQSGKLAGAAAPVENMLQDQKDNGIAPVEEAHEVLKASVASTETIVIDDQQRGRVADTASSGVVFSTMQSGQIARSKNSKSIPVAVNTTAGVEGRRSEDSHLLPFKECQGMVTVLEGNTRHSSNAILAEQLQCGNQEESRNQETDSTGAEVFRIMQSEEVAGSKVSKSTPLTVDAIGGVQERMLEDSHSLPSHECQGMDTLLEENTGHGSKGTLVGQSKSDNDVGSLHRETEYNGAAVQDKNTIIKAEQCGLPQPAVHGRTNELNSTVKEDDGHTDMIKKRVTIAEQRTLGMEFGEVCEEKGAESFKRPARDSPVTSEKGSVKGNGLQLYDGRKYDEDVFMYVPAAIGNVIRSVSQTFKKFFKG